MVYTRIRDLREDNNLTQTEIAEYLNCSQVAYSYYEIGRCSLPLEALIQLAKYYQCSTDYILGLTDEKKPYPPSARMDFIPAYEARKRTAAEKPDA